MNGSARATCANGVPPRLETRPPARRIERLGLLLGAMALAAALYVFDPAQHRVFPVCLFHAVTGLNCPGCGGTRAVHHLLNGNVAAAWRCNALVVLALPVSALAALWFLLRPAGSAAGAGRVAMWLPWVVLAVAAAFAVYRNLPGGAWLSP
ncbi:MAG: DUF2752 domain-containing protein [Verrucomicrobiae bacterium]|nr:DUF2752 domain-containing protein [Verrucomicrobiae bacterium]MDW8310271.1 DUF2752 domain-containing protein [Verrucomicrobiales bacterium]